MNPDHHHKALPKGDQLHWYRIDSILGQGGFGITYLAEDTNLEQRVAIKEYLPNELAVRVDETTVQPISEAYGKMYRWGLDRFLKEAKTLARFKHPNIVRVQSFFEQNNTAYMVMEYEDGRSLAQVIKAGELRGETALLTLLDPILEGLALVHEAGFIHRDIKPDNIFIRQDGSPVLLDFGSARHAISGQTRTLTSLVTPGYAPFEQYHDADGKQGPWTDIYALAATMYRAITGKTPIESIKRGMARINHATDPYLPLADLKAGEYSEHFLEALDCGLRFLEADRPQTVAAWQDMLHGTEPVPPQPEIAALTRQAPDAESAAQPAGGGLDIDFDRPQTLAPTTPAPVTVPTVPDSSAEHDAQAPSTSDAEQPARRRRQWLIAVAVGLIAIAIVAVWFTQRPQPETRPALAEQPAPSVDPVRERVTELLQAAERASDAGRLTAPAGDSALDRYRDVLQLDTGNATARSRIAELLDRHVAAANRAIEAQDFDAARAQIAGAERIDAQALGVELIKEKLAGAEAAARQRRTDEQSRAQARLERKTRIATLLDQARAQADAENYAGAVDRYRQVLQLEADNAVASSGLRTAQAQLDAQHRQRAAAAQRDQRIADALAEGQKLLDAKQPAQAEAAFRKALQLDPENREAQAGVQRARQALAARQQQQAEEQRRRQVQLTLATGERELQAKRLDEAQAAFRSVLKLDPGNSAAQQGLARVKQAGAAATGSHEWVAGAGKSYTLAILPWTMRGADNYEQSIFGGLQQALRSRNDSVRLTHSHYRTFDAGKHSEKLSAGGISGGDLKQVWTKQSLFDEAKLNEAQARAIAKRLGVDAVLLGHVSVAAENARIELHLLDQRSGTVRQAAGQFHFPVWGYHEQSAAQVRALVLEVLPPRI